MNIPKKVKVGGFTYDVIRPNAPFPNGDSVCDGLHVFAEQQIMVSDTGSPNYQYLVFLHELIHAIIGNYCGEMDSATEERFTEAFAKGLYQVIVDNPEIFADEKTI